VFDDAELYESVLEILNIYVYVFWKSEILSNSNWLADVSLPVATVGASSNGHAVTEGIGKGIFGTQFHLKCRNFLLQSKAVYSIVQLQFLMFISLIQAV
jgi:hypothetical protein